MEVGDSIDLLVFIALLKSYLSSKSDLVIEDHYVPEPRYTRTEKAHRCPEASWY